VKNVKVDSRRKLNVSKKKVCLFLLQKVIEEGVFKLFIFQNLFVGPTPVLKHIFFKESNSLCLLFIK
jgi:hypothetical protein